MSRIYIKELTLQNYRNFSDIKFNFESENILILGNNGSGKTNILEALSLFSPGRGVRRAKLDEICQYNKSDFIIESVIDTSLDIARIKNTYNKDYSKRIVEFNNNKITHSELASLLNITWLTPQMDGLFLGSSSDRRKFFDRMVYAFDPGYSKLINEYEHYIKERNNILQSYPINLDWLNAIEEKLSNAAAEITTKRFNTLQIIQHHIDGSDNNFPKARLSLEPVFSNLAIDDFKEKFRQNRELDRLTKKTNFGTHRIDMLTQHQEKQIDAKQCSTGEQKSLLISIILGQLLAINNHNPKTTVVLLDETLTHLDNIRREYLTSFLATIDAQVFITSTEEEIEKYFSNPQKINL